MPLLTLVPELRLPDDGGQYPRVGDDHHDQRDEVDGDEEEHGERGDEPRVAAEGYALLEVGRARRRLRVPNDGLEK